VVFGTVGDRRRCTPDRPQLGDDCWVSWAAARVVAAAEAHSLIRHAVAPLHHYYHAALWLAGRPDGSSYCWQAAGSCRRERLLPWGWSNGHGTTDGYCLPAEQTCSLLWRQTDCRGLKKLR